MHRPVIVRRFLFAATVAFFVAAPALAQSKVFLQITSIPGNSTDPAHLGWIDAYAFSEGLSNAGGGGVPNIQDLNLTKGIDSASPPLHNACALFTNLGTVNLEICPAAGGACTYKIQLDNTMVSSTQSSGAACIAPGSCGAGPEAESISLTFTRIRWTYTPPGGAAKTSCWDRAANKAC